MRYQNAVPVEATRDEPIHLVRFRQSLDGIRHDSEGISEILLALELSREEAARRRASRLERRAMREGRGYAVGFGNT